MENKELVRNDKGFDLTFTVLDADNVAVNLTGSTIKFKMALIASATLKVNGDCTITDPTNGKCKYTVGETDLNTVGTYHAELEITSSGKIITAPMDDIEVVADLPTT